MKISIVSRFQIKKSYLLLLAGLSILVSCHNNSTLQTTAVTKQSHFARGFTINKFDGYRELIVFSPWSKTDTLAHFFIVRHTDVIPEHIPLEKVLRTPLQRIVALSSTQWGPLVSLGEISKVVAVSESRFISNPLMKKAVAEGVVADVAGEGHYNIEKMLLLNPDLILYSPDPTGLPSVLEQAAIQRIPWTDYFENHPLGRAEWINLLGLLVDKEQAAQDIFDSIAFAYMQLCELTAIIEERPSVFADKAFAGQWYVPGGKSYMACLFHDAGAEYVFAHLDSEASVPLDIETIFSKAGQADFWRIAQSAPAGYSYNTLKAENELYSSFSAFKKQQIVFCNTAETGYFESGALEPQKMLADLIAVFHPELIQNHKASYYKLLEP